MRAPEEQPTVLEAQLTNHPVAVERLVDGLAADFEQPRAVAEERALQLRGDDSVDGRRVGPVLKLRRLAAVCAL
jgi:hypothetical protein